MKIEKVRLQTIAGRVVERFPDGAVEDSIIGKEEASQLLRCEEGGAGKGSDEKRRLYL